MQEKYSENEELELVNCVGAGKVPVEIDLRELSKDLPSQTMSFATGGLFFKFEENSPTIRLSRLGNYYITGASSEEELIETKSDILKMLMDFELISEATDNSFSVINMVFTFDLCKDLDLNSLALSLGFENIEYEPEQFPGLVYRPSEFSYVVLIFSSGKLTITGGKSREEAKKVTNHINDVISPYT